MSLFSDLGLDQKTHDLIVTNKDLVVIGDTTDAITQRLKVSLLFFKGEWFLNTEFGVPYYQSILRKGITKTKVDGIFKKKILGVDGVISILGFTSTYSAASREYTVTFSCKASTGDTITLEI
tara:strand:- start:7344 stop:7709 length:366 start_codon:yes stop_codon:yes gene_type:complete